MGKSIDLTNQRFGRLVALRPIGRTATRHTLWECLCDCGNIKSLSSNALRNGTQSCGCYASEVISKNNSLYKLKHGMGTSRAYNTWSQMKQRCDNPRNKNYALYGRKGITYCEKWKTFDGFWEDMGEGYQDGLTLDRIDNYKGYSKENCRWATLKEQSNNKTTNRFVVVKGVRDTISNTARKYGICPALALWRLKNGRSVEGAFLLKPRGR